MDRFSISNLRTYYGALLSERQNEMLRLHFDEDISFGELSEMFEISRQAAFDAVKKGSVSLQAFEDKLKLVARDDEIRTILDKVIDTENNIDIIADLSEIKRLLEE